MIPASSLLMIRTGLSELFGYAYFSSEEKGFGHVNDQTPELGMAVLPEYRGQGIGTSLLSCLIKWAEDHYENISLSVASENPVRRLYERQGFIAVGKHGGSVTMKRKLR